MMKTALCVSVVFLAMLHVTGCGTGNRSTFGWIGAHTKSRKFPVEDAIRFIPRPRTTLQAILDKPIVREEIETARAVLRLQSNDPRIVRAVVAHRLADVHVNTIVSEASKLDLGRPIPPERLTELRQRVAHHPRQ